MMMAVVNIQEFTGLLPKMYFLITINLLNMQSKRQGILSNESFDYLLIFHSYFDNTIGHLYNLGKQYH